jgi:general secretion pathway protein A
MFLNHFHLSQHPFAEKPPADWILCDSRFQEALARLTFFQKQGHIALLIGQTGVGKSSLLRCFIQNLPLNRYQIIYLSLTSVSPNALLRQIVIELGEPPKIGKDRLFHLILDKIRKSDAETFLILDEAHLLSSQSLTDLRLLSSSGIDAQLPLKLILCAQQSLAVTLKQSAHADIVNRISIRCRLLPLSKDQTAAYINHRIHLAGGSDKTFDDDAKSLIHDYSGGIPRLINNIATASLINAASKNRQIIDDTLVNNTMSEFHLS